MRPIRSSPLARTLVLCAVVLAGAALPSAVARADGAPLTPAEMKAITEEAYVFGFPLIMNYGVMNSFVLDKASAEWKAPFNTINNEHRVFTPKDTTVVTPNSDTPYSMLWLDLGAEPVVLCVPEVEKSRYYSVQLVDGNTFNYGYIGSRSTGSGAGCYLVAGPDWKGETPAGVAKVIRCETRFSLCIYRTQLFGPADMPNVEKVQAGYRVATLSSFLHQPAPAGSAKVDWLPARKEALEGEFATYLSFALQFCPPAPEEAELRARMARIGIAAGAQPDLAALSPELKEAYGAGIKAGYESITKQVETIGENINGWRIGSALGDRAFYRGNWRLRAAAAKAGIYGNSAVEAAYPMAAHDDKGEKLDGSRHDYTVTFAAGELPPVNAFWSVTMYDGKTQLLIENPINRYLVNSPMLPAMKKGADGSVTIHIQKDSPGKDLESNWLPAPNGGIYLVMRLYWPKEEAPSILPLGAGTWKPPVIHQVK